MKHWAIPMTTLLLASLPLSARTWTSNDGSNTFEADFKSYDESSNKVTVIRNFKKVTFTMEKLSEADQTWVREEQAKQDLLKATSNAPSVEDQLAEQEVGKNLTSNVLSRLDGKRFAKAELERAPEYYLLYFTASW